MFPMLFFLSFFFGTGGEKGGSGEVACLIHIVNIKPFMSHLLIAYAFEFCESW